MLRKAIRPSFPLSRLLRLTGAGVAVAALALAAAQAWFLYSERLRQESAQLTSLATVLAEHTERAVQGADLILRGAAGRLEREDFDAPDFAATVHAFLLGRRSGVPLLRGALVLDRAVRSVGDSTSPVPRPLDAANREPFAVHRLHANYGLYIGKPVKGQLSGQWSIYMSRRVENARGEFVGVVVVSLDPAYLTKFYGSVDPSPGAGFTLFNIDGTLMARHPFSEAAMGRVTFGPRSASLEPPPPYPSGVIVADETFDGKQRLVACRYMTAYPLIVCAASTTEAAVAPVLPAIWMNVAGGAAIGALAIGLFATLARQAVRREQMAASLRQAKQEADAGRRLAISENRHKTEFWSSIGHEMRSPLNAVIGFAEMLQSDAFGKPSTHQLEYAGYIRDAGRHLLGLINDLLDAAALESGRLKVRSEDFDLLRVAEAAIGMISPVAEKAGIAGEFDPRGLSPALRGDEMRMRQVLLNLLSNAVKYSNAPATVRLAFAAQPGGGVAVGVTDAGIGMSEADIEQALQPFGRADNEEALRRSGTGLGLPIVKRLVELHDGRLEIESQRGRGTTVTIRLPASRVLSLGARADAA